MTVDKKFYKKSRTRKKIKERNKTRMNKLLKFYN